MLVMLAALSWVGSAETIEGPNQIETQRGKPKGKLNPATLKYRTEAEAEKVAQNELAHWLEMARTDEDTEHIRMIDGAYLAPPVKFINTRGKVVNFEYDIKKDGKYVGDVNVDAEITPLENPDSGIKHSSGMAFSLHDSSLCMAASWRVDYCLGKIKERIGKDAKLEGPFFYQMGYYGFPSVAFKEVKTGKYHFGFLADTVLLPKKTTLRSLQEECDAWTQWVYEETLRRRDKSQK